LTGESAPRSKVHSEGIWHRTVHIYLFRKNNNKIEFLVHLRSKFKDLHPNHWDTRFGGHIKEGMTLEEGVKNELEEEIGLKVDGNKLIEGAWRKKDKMPDRQFTRVYYFEYNDSTENLKFNDGEVQEVKWMSLDDIKESMVNKSKNWAPSLKGFTEISDYLIKAISAFGGKKQD